MSRFYKKWMSYVSYPLFLCLFFSTIASLSYGQNTWQLDQQDLQAYHKLLALKINDPEINLQRERNATLYLKHFRNSIELLISEDRQKLDSYEKSTAQILDKLKKQKGDSPYLKFYTAEVLLQSAFVHLKLGHEFSSGWELRKAYREIKGNIKKYPTFLPQYKTIGLLHIIIGSVPEKHNWLLSLLGMEGSVIEGLQELKTLADSDDLFREEAELLILLMQGYILHQTSESVNGLQLLYAKNPNSLLIGYLYVSVLMKSHKNEVALKVFGPLSDIQNSNYIQFSLLQYIKAEALLQKGNYSEAIDQYQQFVSTHKGQNYLKDAHYKTGLAYWLLNESDSTTKYYNLALSVGRELTEADKHANKQLNAKEFPNRKIMEIRLLTDGGYYDKALEKLNKIRSAEVTSNKDRIELNYRKARIYHQTNQMNEAIAFYKLTINSNGKNNWYFAPNSALQLGFIYQAEENQYLAEKYFKIALSYKDHEYKNSIDNKAKSALATMK